MVDAALKANKAKTEAEGGGGSEPTTTKPSNQASVQTSTKARRSAIRAAESFFLQQGSTSLEACVAAGLTAADATEQGRDWGEALTLALAAGAAAAEEGGNKENERDGEEPLTKKAKIEHEVLKEEDETESEEEEEETALRKSKPRRERQRDVPLYLVEGVPAPSLAPTYVPDMMLLVCFFEDFAPVLGLSRNITEKPSQEFLQAHAAPSDPLSLCRGRILLILGCCHAACRTSLRMWPIPPTMSCSGRFTYASSGAACTLPSSRASPSPRRGSTPKF